MTEGQKAAYERGWPQHGLSLSTQPQELAQQFVRPAPLVLEIGFGMGESLLTMAQREPAHNFIGVEVHPPGVGALLLGIEQRQLSNLKVFQDDVREVLNNCIADESLARIQVYFPDPWHKKRHHKRRLIQTDFLTQLAQKLQPGGLLHLATDWVPYAEHMLEVATPVSQLVNQHADSTGYCQRPEWRPETKFERRGERLGHEVRDILLTKQ